MATATHSFVSPKDTKCTDLTARKIHQYTVVGAAVLGLLLGNVVGVALLGVALLLLDGFVMAVGRFWKPADLFRQVVWRVAEPRGWLAPHLVPEDLGTRHAARVLGGIGFFAAAALLRAGDLPLATLITVLLCAMILLDATLNFCALCFLSFQARRLRYVLTQR